MDSFFSLFDPADGIQYKQNNKKQKAEQDSVKKKNEAPKGRRRGRRTNGKNESLPEESSFLCEPEISSELLVKDVSYIENYIEINRKDDDNKAEDKKNKRRSSGRKSRRRKNRVSPPKDVINQGWCNADNENTQKNLNNHRAKPKLSDGNVGKNVNDLTSDFKKSKRKDHGEYYDDRTVYNVIDKLEKVNLKDDMYLAGDFNAVDFENEVFYSSDDCEDFVDDSLSDIEDSAEEAYGSLPPEPRFGNVEYKLQLVSLCERRFQHLVTQLKWRLRSGGGSCVYVVGVRDCGALVGLRPRQLRGSLCTLRSMARALSATLTHVTARRVAPHRAVAEVYIRKLADPEQSVELRVAVMGANEAGKSTLIGVLTQGELDNGRGSARLNMFRHLHEVKSGRTSSLSHEILGFDAQGNVVNYGCSELMTAERIGERSAKLVSFLDLAGHTKYQRTTLHGLTGYSPHYGMLLISATAGITKITEEHISLLLALDMQFFVVITKCELAPGAVQPLISRLADLLEPANKKPVLIKDENHARNSAAPQRLILDTIEQDELVKEDEVLDSVPVFPVSCVRGVGLSSLHAYLLALQPPPEAVQHQPEDETCEFQIDEIFHMGDSSGPVVGGLLAKGRLHEGDDLIMGPLEDGSFVGVRVRSVYRNRVPVRGARAGHCCSVRVAPPAPAAARPRPGMVLLAPPAPAPAAPAACRPRACTARTARPQVNDKSSKLSPKLEEIGKERVKCNNLLQDIAAVEGGLVKNMEKVARNVYSGDSNPGSDEECLCDDKVYLEDPNDPRGCIYFQASVHLQRHSTAIHPGFQCSVHVGNVTQTAIIEGILANNSVLRAGSRAACVFRFVRCPEYLVPGRRLLFTAGLGTRAIGRVTQIFPHIP